MPGDDQIRLLDVPQEPRRADAARPRALSSKAIRPGDVVEVDRKGRRFLALVDAIAQEQTGHHYELTLDPIDPAVSWRTATTREVTRHWRPVAHPR